MSQIERYQINQDNNDNSPGTGLLARLSNYCDDTSQTRALSTEVSENEPIEKSTSDESTTDERLGSSEKVTIQIDPLKVGKYIQFEDLSPEDKDKVLLFMQTVHPTLSVVVEINTGELTVMDRHTLAQITTLMKYPDEYAVTDQLYYLARRYRQIKF